MRQQGMRISYYLVGLLILALGITLNTKTGLGVSPIISVPFAIASIWNLNFGNMTLIVYCVFVLIQFLLKRRNAKLYDLLQIPLSIIFTRFMNLFADHIPNMSGAFTPRLIVLLFAIILTGIGAAMSVNMRLVPNPGDGIVQAISDYSNKEMGFTKNCFDVVNILITITVGFLFRKELIGIGVGTVIAVIGVGRVIAVFNRMCKQKMDAQSGMNAA
ncbi:hypothetical protein lbkm_1422 [Lachnospiraceae bacterium KM106-2]|nr:hypothetical protein lbkm_1422 [Lachnospiraceae bacterium KM106-2]